MPGGAGCGPQTCISVPLINMWQQCPFLSSSSSYKKTFRNLHQPITFGGTSCRHPSLHLMASKGPWLSTISQTAPTPRARAPKSSAKNHGVHPLMDRFRHYIFLFHVPWRPSYIPCLHLHHEMYLLCLLIAVVARSPFKSLTPEVLLGGRGYSVQLNSTEYDHHDEDGGMGGDNYEIIRVN